MTESRIAPTFAFRVASRVFSSNTAFLAAAAAFVPATWKPWGRWATLGLGLAAMLVGQVTALTALMGWYGLELTQLPNVASDGAAVNDTTMDSYGSDKGAIADT